ncbi:MAG TPA: TonB-dependent receptor [Steroidobacteraceae bacterium]|nr:TonB-dependent receptor [Steroidobacteraceae bacterium]
MTDSIANAINKAIFRSAARLTAASALLGFAIAAQAQTAPSDDASGGAETVEEVVVTGFRASLDAALSDKKAASGAIDSIHAEDIAKFPDSNLAESVQRIPGVSIARDAGEGRNISVRGLGPQFTRVRINGMEAMSTTGGTDSSGGANRNRQFDFNVFASELFNSITARKTASADVDEGSLGATVDLRTARPFDFKEFTVVGGLKAAYNDLGEDVDPRATFLISNTFGDGHFGVLFSAAYAERNLIEEGASTVRWDQGSSVQGFATSNPTGATMAQVNAAFHPRIPRYGRLTHEQDRLGLTTSFQWQPNDANLVNLDVLYSDFNAKRDENFLEAFSFSRNQSQGGKPQTSVLQAEIDDNGTMTYGLFNDVDIRSESRHDELETKFYSVALSGSHQLSDSWSLNETVGYSRSDFNNPIQTTITLDRSNTDGYSYDYRDSSRLPAFNYGFDVTNPGNWVFGTFSGGSSEIRIRPQGVDNTFQVAKVDLQWKASDALSVKFGLDYKDYDFVSWEARRAAEGAIPALPAGKTLASMTEVLSGFGSGLDIPAGTPTAWLMPNYQAFVDTFDIYSNTGTFALGTINNASARGNNRAVNEKDKGAFVQAAFNMDWGIPVRGDLGVRYVRTEQTSEGYVPASVVTRAVAENEYSDVLPSLNLVAEFTPDLLLRFGAAKVMTRPALGQITPGGSINLVGVLSVATGNPLLKPTRAKTYDLGLEWYFSEGSLLSGAVFYKDIDTFVQTIVEPIVFNQSGLPLDLLAGTTLNGSESFNFTRPVNTEGGPLKGFEVNFQQQFKFLPGKLSNMGALLNYTYVDSKIDYVTSTVVGAPTVENDLVNLSKNAWNATLYYEADGLSLRTSASYRDRYLTLVPASNAPTIQDAEGTNETLNVDFSASYAFNDHLTVSLEALNLTDEVNDQFIDTSADREVVYTHTGRQLFVGARYKF